MTGTPVRRHDAASMTLESAKAQCFVTRKGFTPEWVPIERERRFTKYAEEREVITYSLRALQSSEDDYVYLDLNAAPSRYLSAAEAEQLGNWLLDCAEAIMLNQVEEE